jgi:hypothetical protein
MKRFGCKLAECGRGSRIAIWKTWLMVLCVLSLLVVVIVFSLPIYQNYLARWRVQQTIFIEDARTRELGILLREITHPNGHVEFSDESLLTDRDGTFVFVEDYDLKHRFLRTAVTAVPLGNGRSRIVHGLFPGDRIVVNGAAHLRWEPDVTPKYPETNCS